MLGRGWIAIFCTVVIYIEEGNDIKIGFLVVPDRAKGHRLLCGYSIFIFWFSVSPFLCRDVVGGRILVFNFSRNIKFIIKNCESYPKNGSKFTIYSGCCRVSLDHKVIFQSGEVQLPHCPFDRSFHAIKCALSV